MATRRQWHLSALSAIVGAALLAACGGGGDSGPHDDAGGVVRRQPVGPGHLHVADVAGRQAWRAAILRRPLHDQYAHRLHTPTSTLSNTATIWVEWVAARVGVPITQAMLGFATTRIPCPAAATPALAQSCTAYGQGGARVTNPIGWKHAQGALTDPPGDPGGRAPGAFRRLQRAATSSSSGRAATTSWFRPRPPARPITPTTAVAEHADRRHGAGHADQEPDRGQRRDARGVP